MLADLLINIGASLIYDFGKAIKNQSAKNETVQTVLKHLGASADLHDFPARYVEALVECRFKGKEPVVMNFFREESIAKVFFDFYYGNPSQKGNEGALWRGIAQGVEALKVGDEVKAHRVNVMGEVEEFWEVFKQKVHESRTVKEVEVEQTLAYLKRQTNDMHELLLAFQSTVKAQGKSAIQIADKIYNIDKIDSAVFGQLMNKPPRLLTNPPFNSEYFIGREIDLQAVEDEYRHNNRLLVLVNGEGGIGKTTLAAKYWYAHEGRYKHLAWIYADSGVGAALLTLASRLQVTFDPNDDEKTQLARLAEALNNLEKPCLLVLDNANDAADLDRHYATLHQLADCHILLTSRTRRSDMSTYEVKALGKEDSVLLFRHHYPKLTDTELPLLHDILQAVGYNTLVTELLAKNLAMFNKYAVQYSLPDLLADLQAKGLLALKNKAVKVMYGSDTLRSETPNDIIAAMYDLAKLGDPERYLLSNLAVLPAENIEYALLHELLNPSPSGGDPLPAGEGWAGADDALRSLEEKGWLEYREADNSFKISPVVQEVTRKKNTDRLLGDCRTLIDTLTKTLGDADRTRHDKHARAGACARLAEAVVQAMPTPDDEVATLCQNIGDYHKDTGSLPRMMAAYQKMLDIQTALCRAEPDNADFKNGLAISYEKLGETHTALGNLPQALTFFEERSRLGKELHDAWPQNVSFKNGLAISYSKLGDTHTALGNLPQALSFFEERSRLGKELHDAWPQNVEFKNGLAISYERLGSTHTVLGNLPQALTFFEERSRLGKELYDAYQQNVSFKNGLAISYSKLGDTHTALGNLPQALTFFEDETRLFEELHDAYPQNVSFKNGLAISYSKLGETHTALGNLPQALTFFEERSRLGKELHDAWPQNVDFKNGLAISYLLLGQFFRGRKNDPEGAVPYIRKGYELYVELVLDYPDHVAFRGNYEWAKKALGE